jgi:hypothetical protein
MIAIGFIIFAVYQALRPADRRTIIEWRSSYWIVPWLAGLLIVSRLGRYNPPVTKIFGVTLLSTYRLGNWVDLGVLAAFSLAIYYWAVYSAMPRAKVHEAVEAVESEASVELETPLT